MRITRRRFLLSTLLFSQCRFVNAAASYTTVSDVGQIKNLTLHDNQRIFAQGYYFPEKESAMFYRVVKTQPDTPLQPHAIIINSQFHIVPQFQDTVSFKQLGLKIDGVTDETKQLRNILRHQGQYLFNAGTLIVSDYIELNSDITLSGQGIGKSVIEYRSSKNNWLFVNGRKGDADFLKTAGYTGRGNYVFKDFTINLRGDQAPGSRSAFIFGRSKNITISNLRFINGKNSHRIECNASQNVLIEHCTFADTVITDKKSHEEINIDFNTPKGFPAYGQWDYSACKNVVIRHCTFENVQTGIACHSQSGAMHQRVFIDNCRFENNTSYPIKLICFEDSHLSELTFVNNGKPLIISQSKTITMRKINDNTGRKYIVKKSSNVISE